MPRKRIISRPILGLAACLCLASAAPAFCADSQKSPIAFYHESYGVKQLDELRAKYDFDEYVSKGKDEFERMNLLKRWTFENITYGGAKQYTELRNALTILGKAKRGEVFWCGNISAVYMQCALSMGWTSRYVLMRNDKHEGHISNDVWSNQYRKWVMIDATWNIHIEKDGVPLSFVEIRDEWIRNKGADLIYVYGAGDNEKRYTKAMLPIRHDTNYLYKFWPVTENWISLTYEMGFVGRNNFFTTVDGSGAYIWDMIYTVKHPDLPDDRNWDLNRYPSPPLKDLFHELNTLEIGVKPLEGKGDDGKGKAYAISLDAFSAGRFTPNFESYQLKLDGGAWKDSGRSTTLTLDAGKHLVKARVRNKFGVFGPESEVEVSVKGGLWSFLNSGGKKKTGLD
jgi:hypothetical protein